MLVLQLVAWAGPPTRILTGDREAVAWIREVDQSNRALLPVVAPADGASLVEEAGGHVRFVLAMGDPGRAAREARLDLGSPCAAVLVPLEEGWAGWVEGVCGMLGVDGWRVEGRGVVDGTDRVVLLPAFAAASGDTEIVAAYRRLERRRSGAIWVGIVGSGLLFASSLAIEERGPRPGLRALQLGGAGITAGALGWVIRMEVDPRADPRRLDGWYDREAVRARVRAHNRRVLGP